MSGIFCHLTAGNLDQALEGQDHLALAPYLPYLTNLLKVAEGDRRVEIVHVLHKSPLAQTIHSLLNSDLSEVLRDAVKEQQLRKKTGSRREDSALNSGTPGPDAVFARGEVESMVRVIGSEVIYLQSQYSGAVTSLFSELLSYTDYRDLITAVLCILCYRLPGVFDVIELVVMLVHLSNPTEHYITSLVLNNPARYAQLLTTFVGLFESSKSGQLEQKVLAHIRILAQLVPNPRQFVFLDSISDTRKRLMIQSVLEPEWDKSVNKIVLSLFSQLGDPTVVSFIKNESKTFEKMVRFSDLRSKLVSMLSSVVAEEDTAILEHSEDYSTSDVTMSNDSKSKEPDDFYCSFLDDTIREDMAKATENDISSKKELTSSQVQKANQLLIIYLNIVNYCRSPLQSRECRELLRLMSHRATNTEDGELFIKLSLSLYMSCNALSSNTEIGVMSRRWLENLLNYSYEGGGKAELILLTGMHLYSGTYEMIGPILSQTTGLTINVSAGHAATIQTLWSQLQSEDQIISALDNVPITARLSNHVAGYLPIHCIAQLINSRSPSCPPNLFKWLPSQLRETREPVHPVLCELISGAVTYLMSNKARAPKEEVEATPTEKLKSIFSPPGEVKKICCTMTGISESSLRLLLSPSNSMSCRVLSFYYLLLYRKGLSDLKLKLEARTALPFPPEYSPSLLGDDSAKTLLLHTRNNMKQYSAVYPTFLKLLVTQFPFLCHPQGLLAEDEARDQVSKLSKNSEQFDVRDYLVQIEEELKKDNESRSFYLIGNLLTRHQTWIPSEIVARCVPHVVHHGYRVQGRFIRLWENAASLNPQQTWLNTARVLISPRLREEDLWGNPLQLFRLPKTVSGSPVGVKILLHMLTGYLSLCKARLSETNSPGSSKNKEHEENKNLFLTLQNSAIVQLLLDLTDCLHDNQAVEADHGYENSALLYNFLHDFFINHDGLSKLVCWQTFKFSQVEGMVNGVPSLHVACKFTTAMLQQPSLQKQLFSVCLLSHLAVQYPITQTLQACNEMFTWAAAQSGQLSTIWCVLSLESFVRIAKAFPPLLDPISRLLLNQKKMLTRYDAKDLKQKLKMYSGDLNLFKSCPKQAIETAFETVMSDILLRMRGS